MNVAVVMRAVGANVRAELARAGKTQAEAAQVLGLSSQSVVSNRLNGHKDFTDGYYLCEVAGVHVVASRHPHSDLGSDVRVKR